MTKMLINFDAQTIDDAVVGDFDIVGINLHGKLYASIEQISDQAFSYSKLLSLTIDELNEEFLLKCETTKNFLKAYDFIQLTLTLSAYGKNLSAIEKIAEKTNLIVLISHYETLSDIIALFASFSQNNVYGIMLLPQQSEHKLTKKFSIADIGNFIDQAHKYSLAACLTGDIEAPDVARLLPFSPDILSFDVSQFLVNGIYNQQQARLIRSLIPREKDEVDYHDIGLGTDRILVNNFILPIAIGAYNHERNRLQKVRFSVAADVLRSSLNPENMRHIFSYDLIIDGIRRLALLEHVDLVETLAERIAAFILAHPRVEKVMVRVEKLELAPESVGIEIERVKKHMS